MEIVALIPDARKADPKRSAAPYLEPRVHKMLSHPLRHEIIMKTGERPWSPSELADATGEAPRRVSEQIEILAKEDLVELVERRPGPKGGLVHYYRAVARFMLGPEEWDSLTDVEQARSTGTILRVLHQEQRESLVAGQFHSDPHHVLIRNPMWLDREGMKKLHDIFCRTYEEAIDVQRESTERQTRSGEKPTRVVASLASCPVPEAGRPGGPDAKNPE